MKRKLFGILMTLCLLIAMSACGNDENESGSSSKASGEVSGVKSGESEESTATGDDIVSGSESTQSNGASGTSTTTNSTQNTNSNTVSANSQPVVGTPGIDLWNAKFPGVTLKRIVWYTVGAEEKQMIKDFEAKTGAKIQDVVVDFENINKTIETGIASGNGVDIGQIYGVWYPSQIISGKYMNVDNYITKANMVDTSSAAGIAKGGFDANKADSYKWGNHYYGLSSYWDVDILVMFYNKNLISTAGYDTPMQMVKNGTWNTDTFYTLASNLTDTDKKIYGYCGGGENTNSHFDAFLGSYGTSAIKYDSNKKPTENLGDPKMLDALKYIQKMNNGATKVTNSEASFYKGNAAMTIDGLYMIPKLLNNKNVPDIVKNNWDFAPIPLAPGNKSGAYPTDWLRSPGIVRGCKNPDAVAAYALFRSKYKGDNLYEEHMTKEQIERTIPFYKNILHPNYGYGKISESLFGNLMGGVLAGNDIAEAIRTNKPLFAAEIKKVVG